MTYDFTSPVTCNEGLLGPSLAETCGNSTFFFFMSLLDVWVRANEKISGICERVKPVETPDDEYDFVVVGGGAAGSVVAARLSEIPGWKVLLLEAGPDEPAGMQVPGFTASFLGTNITWDYKTTNESHACLSTNGSCAWPSGKNLGGNTAQGAMLYSRGNPTDYNNWTEEGNEGWTWAEVEAYFKKGEDNVEIDRVGRNHHRTGGPLLVNRFPYLPPVGHSILAAAEEAGYGVSQDLNGDKLTGFSEVQATHKNGVRRSSASAYLWPVRNRRNLHVSLNSIVTRVIIENNRAVGVEYHKDGELRRVFVTQEVIVTAGAVGSPHLLLLSGIGPKDHLESMNVEVVKDLPGVGENLQDHPSTRITFTINDSDTYDNNWAVAAEYLAFQSGPLSAVGLNSVVGILASSATAPDYPDIQINFAGYLPNCAPGQIDALRNTGRRSIGIGTTYLHPKSRGRITLASNDPLELPLIWANYLGESEDLEVLVEGIRMALAMIDTEALRSYNFTWADPNFEVCSDHDFLSDEYLACGARQASFALYHQSGTCKMGPASDPMAVVDPRLRVYGIKGLRVADGSIMPRVPSTSPAATIMMIGERVADFIKEDSGRDFGYGTCSRGIYGSQVPNSNFDRCAIYRVNKAKSGCKLVV